MNLTIQSRDFLRFNQLLIIKICPVSDAQRLFYRNGQKQRAK